MILVLLMAASAQGAQFKSHIPKAVTPLALPALPARVDLNTGLRLTGLKFLLPATVVPAMPAAPAMPSMTQGALPAVLRSHAAAISESLAADRSGLAGKDGLDGLFFGSKRPKPSAAAAGESAAANSGAVFIVNDEGVAITGRAAVYYQEVRRLVEKLQPSLDLRETLEVMDATYGDVWSKLSVIEALAKQRGIERHNTHLEETLLWVDGVMKDPSGRKVAVHTHKVFFHQAKERQSEIAEGIRRVDQYLRNAEILFARGGKAEQELGSLHEIVLGFDAGHPEIKEHLKQRQAQWQGKHDRRFRFAFVDDLTQKPDSIAAVRQALNVLIKKYKSAGLQNIIEGVIYSRYVGMLLELKTIEHYLNLKYAVVHSGHEIFDDRGHYITELDVVVRDPQTRKLLLVEAKSARVTLPHAEVLRDKVIYKLDTYRRQRARLESAIGGPFDVVFSIDVGPNTDLIAYLKSKEAQLSAGYGCKVSFLFIASTDTALR